MQTGLFANGDNQSLSWVLHTYAVWKGYTIQINLQLSFCFYLLLSRVMRNILWIMWLTLSCSHSSCRDRKERLISATESSLSSTLSDTEFSDSDWLSPESSTVTYTDTEGEYETMWIHLSQMLVWPTLKLCYTYVHFVCFSLEDCSSSEYSHGGSADCCCGFWPDANCLASASELKRAAKGLQEMFWLLLPWSVISLGLNTHSIQDPSLTEKQMQT